MLNKLIPTYVFKSIYDINLKDLYDSGIRLILTDLDNTLITYAEKMPDDKLFEFKNEVLNIGFEIILVSNSRKERVSNFAKAFDIKYHMFSKKPLKKGINESIKMADKEYKNDEIILIGDQLMTDILGANRCKIKSGLIYPIDKKTEKFVTRFNRIFEQFFLNRLRKRKKYKEIYNDMLKEFDEL